MTLQIEITKRLDNSGALRCTRQDGSVTWQKHDKHAVHFALHDLTHYAVETTLGYTLGFFGLIAGGWDIEDTTSKGSRGPLPPEALEVEQMVGLFDTERGSGVLWTTDEFNQYAPRPLTLAEIQNVRAARGRWFHEWFALPAEGTLKLTFELPGALPGNQNKSRRKGNRQ